MNKVYIIAGFLLIWGCANRIAPTGGPKDEEPPVLVRSLPESGQRNYKDLQVELEFNEFITIKSLKEQLIITPRLDTEYAYKFKKRTVYLEFEEPFADSTTYTLNFREGIVDITENLPAQNLQIAFSTGNLLDTLEIFGSVIDMFTNIPMENITVGLYAEDDTLNLFTGPPYYFAKTDGEGHFHFRNIKDGAYKIYAFQDSNKNLTCQSANEAYAFLDKIIVLDTTLFADTLRMEYMNIDTLELTRVRPAGRYFNVLTNKYLMAARLRAANDSLLYYHYNEERKGLIIYNTFPIQDSLQVYLTVRDSLEQIARDTFYLKFPETTRRPNEFDIALKDMVSNPATKTITGEITFTKPIKQISLDSVEIYRDSITSYSLHNQVEINIDSLNNKLEYSIQLPQLIIDSLQAPRLTGKANLEKKKTKRKAVYKLRFPAGTFYSVEDDTSKTLEKEIILMDPSKAGIITGNITTDFNSYFIQLLDLKYEVIQESKPGKSYKFSGIKPGEYFIRILIDENNNGQWDHSDIRINRMAEPVLIYQDETGNNKTAVRANWEISVDLNF